MKEKLLKDIYALTHTLGEPHRQYVIIGEGNTSCRIDEDSFWIKASGQQMGTMGEDGFVAVKFGPILKMLEHPGMSDVEQKALMQVASADPRQTLRPSIEVSFHAMLLHETGAGFVGHTHPVYINQIMCSTRAQEFAANRVFPDEVVLCGPKSLYIPYADPGLTLAIQMRDDVRRFMDENGEAPKVLLMASHGMIALGQTATEVLNIMSMCVKAAQVFIGACTIGEPVFLSQEDINHLYKRPDEIYRRNQFVEGSSDKS